jgi:hypothetical protein
VFSEYALQNPKVWDFIRPILAENGGWAIFNFTPRGKNHGYDLYEMARQNPKWFVQKLTVDDTAIITSEVIQEERESGMSEEMIQQEYYCSFTAALTGKGLPEAIKILKEKPYTYGKHFAPHDIQVRELGTGKSRLEVAKELGINFEIVPNISIQDGIDAGRRFFKKLWVDKTLCKDWLKLIPQYTKEYDEEKKIFKDKPLHDWTSHGADEHRYASLVEDKMDNGLKQPTYQQPEQEAASLYGG